MFFQSLADLAAKEAGAFLDVSAANGTFDIFQSARDKISSSLYTAGIAGVVSRQAYRIYQGVSSLVSAAASSSSSPLSTPFSTPTTSSQNNNNSTKMRKDWSQGSTKRLENFLRIGASSYSCTLGSNVREYFKKVFEPPTTSDSSSTSASREEKIAKIVNQAKSRLAGLVVISVIQSYLFTIEIVLSTVVHPIALYELHKIRIEFEQEQKRAIDTLRNMNSESGENNDNEIQQQSLSPFDPMMMMQQQQQQQQLNNGGWLSKVINVALKASIGDAPPPELLQPPPTLELRGAAPGDVPSAEAEKNSSKNGAADDDDDDETENKKKPLNVILLQLIRALKQETETFLQQELEKASNQILLQPQENGKSAFENPLNRVSVSRIEDILVRAVRNPALYSNFSCSALEWMMNFVFGSNDNFANYTRFGNNKADRSTTVDPVVYQIYYRYLTQVVCSDSFVKLTKKSSEIIFEKIALPELHAAWKTCKSFKSDEEEQQESNAATATTSNTSTTATATVQVIHIGSALISCVYKVAETELTKILLPELFVEEAKFTDENETTTANDNNTNGQNPEEQEDEATQERKLRERQIRMARKFPSFGDLSSFGGLCMQFARFTIECNVGGEWIPE